MRKYTIIATAGTIILSLILASWWGTVSDKLNTNTLLFLTLVVIIVGAAAQGVYAYYSSWKKVGFSKWEKPFPQPVWGGIRLENDTWVDLKECKAELVDYFGDTEKKLGKPLISEHLSKEGSLQGENSLLYWLVDGKLEKSANVDKGKEGHIVLAFGVNDEDKAIVSPKPNWVYKITTTSGQVFYHPFDTGFIFVRVSAKVKEESLDPIFKRIRLEVVGDTLYIKKVEDAK